MSEDSLTPETGMDTKAIARGTPVAGTERIVSIDMLRGIAVAGILVMNIYGFAMPFTAYSNPLAYGGTEWYNLGTWYFTHIFFDQKFLPIFSMLFGAGLVMMAGRAEARGVKYGGTWYRRCFWLIVIGAAHGYLLFFGDILFAYAVIGMLIYPLRNLKSRTLIIVACIVLPVGLLLSASGGIYMTKLQASSVEIIELQEAGEELTEEQSTMLEEWEAMSVFLGPPEVAVQNDLDGYQKGYGEIVTHRAPVVIMMQTSALSFLIWRVGGLMILGMALMKLGVLSGERSDSFYRKLMLTGYVIGFPIVLYGAYDLGAHQFDAMYMFRRGGMWNYVGSILVSLGHISVFMLLVNRGALRNLMQRFAALGRMALTNYLMHSVILTTVFYGYGLGLYGTIPRFWQMGFVFAVVAFQLWFSPFWLRQYRFGPVEWLWRSLTYWKWQPLRRSAPA
jgi:uncharacterized protein